MILHKKRPRAVEGARPGMSIAADYPAYTAPLPAEQLVSPMLALHLGDDWLCGWAAGRSL